MLTPKTWEAMRHMLGRHELAARLFKAFYDGEFGYDPSDYQPPSEGVRLEIAKAIEEAWTFPEWPEQQVDRDSWIEMFETVGFLHNSVPSRRPMRPVTVYRGSTSEHRDNLAWTDSLEQARWFAARNRDRWGFDAKVWMTTVEPSAILAHFDEGRDENEWIIDTRFADIVEAD